MRLSCQYVYFYPVINCRSARDTLTKEFDENYDEYERTFSIDRGLNEEEPCELKNAS